MEETDLAENLHRIQEDIISISSRSGMSHRSVVLVAVTKMRSLEEIRFLLKAGHRVFGENKVQEAQDKWLGLRKDYPDLCLHLIGRLQTNKVRRAVTFFDVIETVDRPKLADALAHEMQLQSRWPDCLIQVNTGGEPQKSGIQLDDVDSFIIACQNIWKLPVKGLMCIPPAEVEPTIHFSLLQKIATRHNLTQLSMGMSNDFVLAIPLGATYVRIGTALFQKKKNCHQT